MVEAARAPEIDTDKSRGRVLEAFSRFATAIGFFMATPESGPVLDQEGKIIGYVNPGNVYHTGPVEVPPDERVSRKG